MVRKSRAIQDNEPLSASCKHFVCHHPHVMEIEVGEECLHHLAYVHDARLIFKNHKFEFWLLSEIAKTTWMRHHGLHVAGHRKV